jgi:hypothetical protein
VATELIIVARDNPELYESLKQQYADRPEVEVIVDRRVNEQTAAMRDQQSLREHRSHQELAVLAMQGYVRVQAGVALPLPEEHPAITRLGPPTPRQVTDSVFTLTIAISQYPSKTWRDFFVQTKDRTIDLSPDKVRFYQNYMIFESEEKLVPTWVQFITRWLTSANERYARLLRYQRQARVVRQEFARDPNERLREAAERFKNL